jgi:hypothetical protein
VGGIKLPLGHAAVVSVDKQGNTRYYEYGRYGGSDFGNVERRTVLDLVMGKDGKPTEASLKNLYDFVSKNYGQGRPVSATYDATADAKKVNAFAEQRRNDPKRDPYNLLTNNCKTFAKEAVEAGQP